ncbi:unnamed protein product [Moneuplotes crassus]|uniref:Uncharacterized protein n=1 Tax=Euplotes crassus TaxID=5936 RepID=A0AAD1XPT0_EUPCR|nr:unnamed protein product [Moneuplotes crassus]
MRQRNQRPKTHSVVVDLVRKILSESCKTRTSKKLACDLSNLLTNPQILNSLTSLCQQLTQILSVPGSKPSTSRDVTMRSDYSTMQFSVPEVEMITDDNKMSISDNTQFSDMEISSSKISRLGLPNRFNKDTIRRLDGQFHSPSLKKRSKKSMVKIYQSQTENTSDRRITRSMSKFQDKKSEAGIPDKECSHKREPFHEPSSSSMMQRPSLNYSCCICNTFQTTDLSSFINHMRTENKSVIANNLH